MEESIIHEGSTQHEEGSSEKSSRSESVSEGPERVSNRVLNESEGVLEESSLVSLIDSLGGGSVFFQIPFVFSSHGSEGGFKSLVSVWNVVVQVELSVISKFSESIFNELVFKNR